MFFIKSLNKVLVGALLLINLSAIAQSSEYQVKAMFIFNFLKYIEWPASMETGTIKIVVDEASPVYLELLKMAAHKKFNSRSIEVIKLQADDLRLCHIIIISAESKLKYEPYLKKMNGKNILIVSEDNSTISKGYGINLLKEENKIKFEINLSTLKNEGLKISKQLELLASIVIH